MLHYVGLAAEPSEGLAPGFHRLSFNAGQVLLTLCVGELKSMLRAQDFRADSIFLAQGQHSVWDDWTVQALLHCCRRGTQLSAEELPEHVVALLIKHGFDIQPGVATGKIRAHFNPRWPLQATRRPLKLQASSPSNCVVIGAGLAGASTAASLARRGWQAQVLDSAALPANAASGLPVGLMAPPLGGEADIRAHLLKAGIQLTLQQAQQHLANGQDWSPSGIMMTPPGDAARWEPNAAWIKPHRLVHAWLAHPGIQFRGNARVASMEHAGGEWILRDTQGTLLAQANLVVLACAGGTQSLLAGQNIELRQPLAGIHGQVSWALRQESDQSSLPPFPLNGSGHLVPDVPTDAGPAWFAGATYVLDGLMPAASDGHDTNLERLAQLHPPSAGVMTQQMREGSIRAWQGTRFATPDRMPLVGHLNVNESPDGLSMLCINSGFGSRGLSWSVLCAELLAAHIGNEPLPIPRAWSRLLRGTH